MNSAIDVRNLSKTFEKPASWRRLLPQKGITAVDNVTLEVAEGELFGLLGPNGAGKTTLVKLLCTLITPTSGSATIAHHPLSQPGKIREVVGLVVSDERSFFWRLSARRNLLFFASLYGLHGEDAEKRIAAVLDDVDLGREADIPFRNFSTGMRQRLAIARSLLHQPQILFLDEPSRSLDPTATARLHDLILNLMNSKKVTIFLITHDLPEAENLCQRVAVMHRGRIQIVGEPANLRRTLRPQQFYEMQINALSPEAEAEVRAILPDVTVSTISSGPELHFQAGQNDGILTRVIDCLRGYGTEIIRVEGKPPTLEEVFAHYTMDDPGEAVRAPFGDADQPATAQKET